MATSEQWLGRDDKLQYGDVRSAERYVRLATALAQLQVVRHVIWQDILRDREFETTEQASLGLSTVEIGSGRQMTVGRNSSEYGGGIDSVLIRSLTYASDRRYGVLLSSAQSVLTITPGDPQRALTAQAILENGLPGANQAREFADHALAAYKFVQTELRL